MDGEAYAPVLSGFSNGVALRSIEVAVVPTNSVVHIRKPFKRVEAVGQRVFKRFGRRGCRERGLVADPNHWVVRTRRRARRFMRGSVEGYFWSIPPVAGFGRHSSFLW